MTGWWLISLAIFLGLAWGPIAVIFDRIGYRRGVRECLHRQAWVRRGWQKCWRRTIAGEVHTHNPTHTI